MPECSREQGEDGHEGPFYNSEADVNAETADGEHEGQEAHGEEEEGEGGGEFGRIGQAGGGVHLAEGGRVVPVGADGGREGRGEGEPECTWNTASISTKFQYGGHVSPDLGLFTVGAEYQEGEGVPQHPLEYPADYHE